ncbi:MAG TPA: DNA polymerase III subunit beta [Candidatus Gracilibacteria bacterium]
MKFTIAQKDLLESLKVVSRAVSSQNTLPVLANILIKAEGKKVYFAATNLEISISTYCEAEVKNEGAITVPSKILTAYASLLGKGDDIELKLGDGLTLEVNSKSSKTKIKGIAADEFPAIARVESGNRMMIDQKQFRDLVDKVAFSAQENASRPILSGISFVANKESLRVAATDSYRLSEKVIKLGKPVENLQCIIPVRAIIEADRLCGGEGAVSVTVSDNQVMFTCGNTELVSRLIEGKFPDYAQILPKEKQTTVEVDRSELELAVRRVSIFAKENNQHMKLEFVNDGYLTISTDSTQIGEEKTTVPIKLEGANNAIALNADYVLDVLTALSDQTKVRIELEKKLNPAVFKNEKEDDFVHLIMPLKM